MDVQQLARAFHQRGWQLHRVGGCVRDSFLARESHDIDLCSDAKPVDIDWLLQAEGLKSVTIAASFGIVTTFLDEGEVQIATWRGDDAGRKPEDVTFVASLREDLARRDFTINAIAQDALTSELVDPFGGLQDIEHGVIRAVGSPTRRIAEDPLRILRAVRFAAQLNFNIEPETAQACAESAQLLAAMSRERVRDELCKMLVSANPGRGLRLCRDLSLLPFIHPALNALVGCLDTSPFHIADPDVFNHTLNVVTATPNDIVTRLSALLHDVGKPISRVVRDGLTSFHGHEDTGATLARDILADLKFDNAIIKSVVNVVALHMRRIGADSDKAARRIIKDAGDDLDTLLSVMRADANDSCSSDAMAALDTPITALRGEGLTSAALRSPITGEQIMEVTGLRPGKEVGRLKKLLDNAVVEGVLSPTDVKGALNFVKENCHV